MTDVRALILDQSRLQELIEDDRVTAVLKAYAEGTHAEPPERHRDYLAIQ
ncbi:hypothetical protein [Methylorubrum sp. Q1]|nr:hypothetical protein [Methylorubrum sp. Q1]